VLHAYKVHQVDRPGGIPSVMAALARGEDGVSTASIVTARPWGRGRRLHLGGAPITQATSLGHVLSMPVAPTYPALLARACRQVDLLAHHAPFPLNDLAIACGLPERVALAVHWHADIVGRPTLARVLHPLLRRTLERADRIIVADSSMVTGSPLLGPLAAKCAVIPYGVDADYWQDVRGAQAAVDTLRQRFPRMVAAVGRLVAYKGFDVLVRALQHLDATAVVIGDGPARSALTRLARRVGVGDRLVFLGRTDHAQVRVHLHAARALAFPSVTAAEAFGIVQLEAMAAGLPIVNTMLPTAVPAVARHGQEGLTVPPGDPLALAAALGRLLDDPALARTLGERGRQRVRTMYGRSAFVALCTAVYRAAVAERRARVRMPAHAPGAAAQ
jgi:rhamnosyl/mannosyltransferase